MKWYVIMFSKQGGLKSIQDTVRRACGVFDELSFDQISIHVPMVKVKEKEEPLFGNYGFIGLPGDIDIQRFFEVCENKLNKKDKQIKYLKYYFTVLKEVVKRGNGHKVDKWIPAEISYGEVYGLKPMLSPAKKRFKVGEYVKVINGVFADFEGVVKHLSLTGGAVGLEIFFFGKDVSITVDEKNLESIGIAVGK